MCQIALHTADAVELGPEVFETEDCQNPDGFGIGVSVGGELYVRKGLFSAEEAYGLYCEALYARDPGAPILLHWRWATTGAVEARNCHPFLLANDSDARSEKGANVARRAVAVAHNGMLPHPAQVPGDWSDTWYFLQVAFAGRTKAQLMSRHFAERTESVLGSSRLAWIADDGRYRILNAGLGEWSDGTWYSAGVTREIGFRGQYLFPGWEGADDEYREIIKEERI